MIRISWGRVALPSLIAVAAQVERAPASVDAAVNGVVEDALMHPLEGAKVVIHDASGNTVGKTLTDKDGRFTFAGVPFGDYTIEASSPGLVSDHQHLQITSSQVISVELVLVSSEEVIRIEEDWSLPEP